MNDHTTNQPGTSRAKPTIDQQVERVTILLETLHARLLSTGLYFTIMQGESTREVPARAKRGEERLAWLFVKQFYEETHNTRLSLQAYNRAIEAYALQLAIAAKPDEDKSEEDEKAAKGQVKRNIALNRELEKAATRLYNARSINYRYLSIEDDRVFLDRCFRGIWRVGEATKVPVHLFEASIDQVKATRPIAGSTSKDYTISFRLTNRYGHTRPIVFDSNDRELAGLAAQCIGFCSLPENRFQKECLLEAIKEIVQDEGTIIQDETDSLGWFNHNDLGKVWVLSNGVETPAGFLPGQKAPFLAPKILSPGNGYYGCEVPAPTDEAMSLLLNDLLPQGKPLLAGLLGLAARAMLPIPNDDTPGMVRFCSEIIGPSRHGKTRVINALLSLNGSKFSYNQATLLNYQGGNDSSIGRGGLASYMRYQLFSDFDHKASPENSQFEKIHKLRADTNNIYADNTGGGTVGRQHGGIRARAKPTGALIRTSNYDHLDYSLRHDEDMEENRVCSFVWPRDLTSETGYARANDEVSHKLEEVRLGLYSWGVAFRKWIMQYDQALWESYIEEMYQGARGLVYGNSGEWACDLHRNQTVELIVGLLIWQDFINQTYENSFMNEWISKQLDQVIEDRKARCVFIGNKASTHSTRNELRDFVTRIIRQSLHTHQLYIVSQQDKDLTKDDTSYQLDLLGYKRYASSDIGNLIYERGDRQIGYLVNRGTSVAFITNLLLDNLTREADKNHFDLPDKNELLTLLVEAGVISSDKAGKSSQLVKINGKPGRYLVMPLSVIYPQEAIEPGEEASLDEDETPAPNIVKFPKPHELNQQILEDTLAGV